ncbi:MAG: methyltransferase domain-containing protein [Rhodobacteraceae bacterium]|nr:methyltransferase domain-containing protein [Paracoccaceae bacterium]
MLNKSHALALSARQTFDKVVALRAKASDEVRFLRSWVETPLRTGAITPSGPQLAEKMASYLEPLPGTRVLELGPGTGVMSAALIRRGIAPENILAVEYSDDFCTLIARRFPQIKLIQGDAYDLPKVFADPLAEDFRSGALDGIVSSLPLMTRPEEDRNDLVVAALNYLKPGAPFIQFSYALTPPVKAVPGLFTVTGSQWIWKNFPPARVWVYRKSGH